MELLGFGKLANGKILAKKEEKSINKGNKEALI